MSQKGRKLEMYYVDVYRIKLTTKSEGTKFGNKMKIYLANVEVVTQC